MDRNFLWFIYRCRRFQLVGKGERFSIEDVVVSALVAGLKLYDESPEWNTHYFPFLSDLQSSVIEDFVLKDHANVTAYFPHIKQERHVLFT